jgi:hypothetical protein
MPTIEEINSHLVKVVSDGYQFFNKELNSFHANPTNDQGTISTFLNRVSQYSMLFWGYENVTKSLGTASADQINQVGQIRAIVDGAQRQVQDLLNHLQQSQNSYQMPTAGRDSTQDFNNYQSRVMAEVMAKRQQMYNYTNRLYELTQGGIPFIQAQILARQETGYMG